MNQHIVIAPNRPLYVALADPEGDSQSMYDFELNIGRYQTIDGRILALPRPAVIILNELEPAPGEEVQITKLQSGKQGEPSQWSICLSARTENARAEAAELTATPPEALSASVEARNGKQTLVAPATPIRRPVKSAPAPELPRGTGTYGPEPALLTAAALRKQHAPIPANVANREILQFIESDPNTKNWSDQAKQDLLSTYVIAFTKTRHIGLWERGQ